jgi:YebC/PmpR family DNA-binding regulatory protein
MGRAFEYRKATKLKRWGHMARTFTKLGKEITIAAREGGPDPDSNPRLRTLIQQCKKENMPKDNIDRAIKKATDKSYEGYKEINYEGYGPHGIAIFVETATDNNMRTVANIRSYFTKHGGTLGTQGSLQFLFDRKACFTVTMKDGIDLDELELELIDFGVDELGVDDENNIIIYGAFESYSDIQKYLEENGFEIKSAEFVRIPNDLKEVTPEEREGVQKLIDKIEEDEDVQNVFTNMAPEE